MRKLSTRRRHPLAGIVVLLLALGVVGGVYSAVRFQPASAAETASQNDVDAGRKLFLVGCASCHGKNASGIETKRGGNYGPSLIGVGAAAVDFQVGTGRMPMGIPAYSVLAGQAGAFRLSGGSLPSMARSFCCSDQWHLSTQS